MLDNPQFRVWDGKKMFYVSDTAILYFEEKGRWFLKDQGDNLICNFLNGKLMLYTGLRDRNKYKIFTGDILSNGDVVTFGRQVFESYYSVYGFGVQNGEDKKNYDLSFDETDAANREVIGNVYESPELLK